MIQLFLIKLSGVEIHRNQIIGEEDTLQFPLDYLSNWLSEAQFKIPKGGIEIDYLGAQLPWKSCAFQVYRYLQITLPIHGEQTSYHPVQDLWLMSTDEDPEIKWYIRYEDDLIYTPLNNGKDHSGCTGQGHTLLSVGAAEALEKFLDIFHTTSN